VRNNPDGFKKTKYFYRLYSKIGVIGVVILKNGVRIKKA
jgi:hypothetical protein